MVVLSERLRLLTVLLVSTALFVLYLCLAALVMQAEELPTFRKQVSQLQDLEKQFLQNHSLDADQFYQFLEDYTELLGSIPGPDRRNYQTRQAWNFIESFFYMTSVVTTIGYGNMTPVTPGGQMWTVTFALAGVPFFIFIIHAYTAPLEPLLLGLFRSARQRMCKTAWSSGGGSRERLRENMVVLCFVLTLVLLVLMLIPSVVFSRVEGWTYEQSLYYVFISIATIGFGDYEAGINVTKTYSWVYIVFVFVWLFVSILSLGLALSLYRNIISHWNEPKTEDMEPLIPMDSIPNDSIPNGNSNSSIN